MFVLTELYKNDIRWHLIRMSAAQKNLTETEQSACILIVLLCFSEHAVSSEGEDVVGAQDMAARLPHSVPSGVDLCKHTSQHHVLQQRYLQRFIYTGHYIIIV